MKKPTVALDSLQCGIALSRRIEVRFKIQFTPTLNDMSFMTAHREDTSFANLLSTSAIILTMFSTYCTVIFLVHHERGN